MSFRRPAERARRLVDAGQRPQVEVIRAESGVAQQLEAIIVAENTLRDRERELKRVINKAGMDMQTPTVVVPATAPDPVRYDLEQARLIRQAMDSRMELLELQLQLLQDAEQRRILPAIRRFPSPAWTTRTTSTRRARTAMNRSTCSPAAIS